MKTAPRPIIAVGDLVWDVLVKPDHKLLPGGDTTGHIALAPGGSAANTAVWIARAGMPAGFVGKVGADTIGNLAVADLEQAGVAAHIARTSARDTGIILVMLDQAGQRSMVTNQGADFHLMPQDVPHAPLEHCAHVHITAWSLFSDPPRAAALHAAQIAKAAGATVSLDPGSFQMIQELGVATFDHITAGLPVDMLFPNRDEGRVLSGETEPAAMAQVLHTRYNGATIVLKLDSAGCYVRSRGSARQYPTEPVTVVDTTGAGDAFDAAFLACYFREQAAGRPGETQPGAAAQFANAIGRWVVARYGARPPVDAELAAILQRMAA